MEPIFLEPIYKHHVWGGYEISKELKGCEEEQISESWEIADNKNGMTAITNGQYKGKFLNDLIKDERTRTEVFGTNCKNIDKFPLLIKFIDAKENLSVQVHPDDAYAKTYENDTGKTELWHIIDCADDAKIICGLKNNAEINNINESNISDNLEYLPIKKGDSILIKAGTVHAIMGNTLLCEIQQNSDLTYRVFDWNRNNPDRPLHLDKARDVINIACRGEKIEEKRELNKIENISHNKFFFVDKLKTQGHYTLTADSKTFQAINVISGSGSIVCNSNEYKISQGSSFLIPANMGEYTLKGDLEVIISYIGTEM